MNGALGQNEVNYWSSIAADASQNLCDRDSTPTTYWRDYFGSAITNPTGTDFTASEGSGRATLVGDTDVSYYYTAPDSQGPGIMPTVTPQTGSETGTGTETTTTTTTTSSDEISSTETQTQTGDNQGSGDNEDTAGRIFAHGAAGLAAVIAGAALIMIL